MKKIGLMGGTFDPIHNGHLLLARFAKESLALDEVWFLPAGYSYFKSDRKVAAGAQRLEMTRLAISGDNDFSVCDYELQKSGNTYSFETLEALNVMYPDYSFYFLMGADCLYSIEKWYRPHEIWSKCHLVAAARSGANLCDMQDKADELSAIWQRQTAVSEPAKGYGQIHVIAFPDFAYSSTMIRERIAASLPVRHMLPDAVIEYIMSEGLYQDEK